MKHPIQNKRICRNCIYYMSKFSESILANCAVKGYRVTFNKKCRRFEMREVRGERVYELTDYAVGRK